MSKNGLLWVPSFFLPNLGKNSFKRGDPYNFSLDWNFHLRFAHLIFEKMKKFKTNRPKIPLLKLSNAVEPEVNWKETSKLCKHIKEQPVFPLQLFFLNRFSSFREKFLRKKRKISQASQKKRKPNPIHFYITCLFSKMNKHKPNIKQQDRPLNFFYLNKLK